MWAATTRWTSWPARWCARDRAQGGRGADQPRLDRHGAEGCHAGRTDDHRRLGPTADAVALAEAAGITLIALARPDRFELFTHSDRLTTEENHVR
jgi:hypothetical protein